MLRIAALVFIALAPTIAFGWGGTGHQIVCLIAEDHLTPAAKAGIKALLGDGNNISDGEIASWADEVRRQRENTGPWHYVDIPASADKYDAARDGKHGNNVIDAIAAQEKILSDPKASKDARAEGLKFLVHFMGDIHQPLHCAERDGDKGGNTRLVFYPGSRKAVNLHSVWDNSLLRDDMHGRRVLEYAQAIDKKISAKDRAAWAKGMPED